MRITEYVVVVCTPELIIRAECILTRSAGLTVLRTQVLPARITRLCMGSTGDGVTDSALYPVSTADIVAASGARFEMVSTERFVTQGTEVRVSWASDIITLRAGFGVVSTDNVIADSTFPAVSLTDFFTARITRG